MVQVSAFDHLVLRVGDARRSVDWYRERLGLESERFAEWEAGNAPFPSVRVDDGCVIDLIEAERTGTNVDHLCLVVAVGDVELIAGSSDFEVVDGPDDRWGARGMGRSVYVLDPDGNVIELRAYPVGMAVNQAE
jgi:catechol 2,3-dioxygenase-like lactoylglutathione lyase family enzyme